MRSSRLPAIKTLDDFDFSFQPSIKREQIDSLHELGFLERKENVIFPRPAGRRQDASAISLAIAAAQSGRRVYYGALADLITSLEEARPPVSSDAGLKILTYPSLLVIDEIGYLPVSQTGAMLFFQLINRRYERASTVLTSNKGFEEWGQILGDEVMAAALIDRLLYHCYIVNIRASSYRMRKHIDLSKDPPLASCAAEPFTPQEKESKSKGKSTTRGSSPPPGVTFSPATFVTFSTGVDTMCGASARGACNGLSKIRPQVLHQLIAHQINDVGPGVVGVELTLGLGGRRFAGGASGKANSPGRDRLPALATLSALGAYIRFTSEEAAGRPSCSTPYPNLPSVARAWRW